MRPILFEILGWEIPSWHFFFALAACFAYVVALLCARYALSLGHARARVFLHALNGIFVVCYVSGWFGARALSIVVEQFEVQTAKQFAFALFSIGPMTFYGGACAAVVCGSVFAWRRGVDLRFGLDCGILGGVFALALGRVGCFLNGDDFGAPIPNQAHPPWWAVKFDILQDGGLYRYPVQLEEAFAALIIGVLGLFLFRRIYGTQCAAPVVERSGDSASIQSDYSETPVPQESLLLQSKMGSTAAWVALLAAGHRLFNENFRGDPRGLFFGTQISTSSGISLLIIGFCSYCLIRLRRSHSAVQTRR